MGMDPVSIALMAAVVVSATGSVYSGVQQKHAADANAEMARREGNQQQDAAVAQAEKIRRAGQSAAAQANAATAAAGVSIGAGTPVRVNEQIYKNSEDDAYSTLLTGARRQSASNTQAGMLEFEGRGAQTAGVINGVSTVLNGVSTYGNWQTAKKRG